VSDLGKISTDGPTGQDRLDLQPLFQSDPDGECPGRWGNHLLRFI
jgi:hypothetical protein